MARRHPNPRIDQRIFDRTWSDKGRLPPDGPEFAEGEQPHQLIQAKAIVDEHDRSSRVLSSLAGEYANYLVILVMFTGLVGFATTSVVVLVTKSPSRWWIVLLGGVLFVLLSLCLVALVRSHASKLTSWTTNYKGPGKNVRHITTEYAYVNSRRIDTLKKNWYAQRSKRMLSLVAVLYLLTVGLVCVAVIIGIAVLKFHQH